MKLNKIYVSDTLVATRRPYLYCICILKPMAFVYIGQSAQRQGAMGRFVDHISEDGTLLKKAYEAGVDNLENISAYAIDLTEFEIFDGLYSRRRAALEKLVHLSMKAKGCKANIPFEVISFVQNSSLMHDGKIQDLAKEITDILCENIPFFKNY